MSNYQYKNPLDQGYKQFKLTKKQHNELFQYRQIKWCDKYEYYYNDNMIILHRFTNWLGIVLITISFPIEVLYHGFHDIKDTLHMFKKLYNEKKYGAFSGDSIHKNSELYTKIINTINKEDKLMNLNELKEKLNVVQKRYNKNYESGSMMANDLLDEAEDVISLQGRIIDLLDEQNFIYNKYFIELMNQIESELEKDGWCRLVMKVEDVKDMKQFLENFYK